jgi:hypothetical protein
VGDQIDERKLEAARDQCIGGGRSPARASWQKRRLELATEAGHQADGLESSGAPVRHPSERRVTQGGWREVGLAGGEAGGAGRRAGFMRRERDLAHRFLDAIQATESTRHWSSLFFFILLDASVHKYKGTMKV